ncbi:MAG: hypothetical protein AAF518_25200 [Spirochaetota bacterium]
MNKWILSLLLLISQLPLQALPKLGYFFYTGRYTETDLLPILFQQKTDYRKSDIATLGVTYPITSRIRMIRFEGEGNVVKHFGLMSHIEANVSLNARISNLFWLPLSLAFGEGMSLASQNPSLENKGKGVYYAGNYFDPATSLVVFGNLGYLPIGSSLQIDSIKSSALLNFVMVELEYSFPQWEYQPGVFMRIHHRSGVFGLYCQPDPACGSNFVSYGLRIWF